MAEYQSTQFQVAVKSPWILPNYKRYTYGIKGSSKNTKGQYISGSVLFEYEDTNETSTGITPTASVKTQYTTADIGIVNSNRVYCIIAIPQASAGYKIKTATSALRRQYLESMYNSMGRETSSWTYLIAVQGGALQIADTWKYGYVSSISTWSDEASVTPNNGTMQYNTDRTNGRNTGDFNELVTKMIDYNLDAVTFAQTTIQAAGLIYDALGSDVLLYQPMGFNLYDNLYPTNNIRLAARVTSTLPVFNILDPDSIINYFQNGDISGADNIEDLTLSDINLATDWTIYVKGARYPDIYVTMASAELNTFLESDKNTTGLSKDDFIVEYKYFYSPDSIIADPEYRPWQSTPYNKTLSTSYKELYTLEEGEWDEPTEAAAIQDYVRLQFRIRLKNSDTYFSRWCYFKIGYIGSPSVPKFNKMDNEGGVVSISDGSTVTIIYDELPPDLDDYENPKNDSDVGNETQPSDNTNMGLGLLTTSYEVTDSNLQKLGAYLWGATFFDNIKLLNNSPIENIVGCKVMPCSVSSTTSSIVIGNVDTKVNGDRVTNIPIVNVGSFNYRGYYGNFLDYAPYTQAYIFLPFIGFVELDPAQYTGHEISVKYAFDVVMGQCKAMLFCDDIYVQSYEGVCGIDVPLVASDRAQVEGGMVSGMASAAIQGDVVSTVSEFATRQYHSTRAGGYSSTLGWVETRLCFIVLILPDAQYPTSYGHDAGYPCNLTCNLGTLSGFTVCSDDIDLSGFSCTESEKEQIKQLLTSGVYL